MKRTLLVGGALLCLLAGLRAELPDPQILLMGDHIEVETKRPFTYRAALHKGDLLLVDFNTLEDRTFDKVKISTPEGKVFYEMEGVQKLENFRYKIYQNCAVEFYFYHNNYKHRHMRLKIARQAPDPETAFINPALTYASRSQSVGQTYAYDSLVGIEKVDFKTHTLKLYDKRVEQIIEMRDGSGQLKSSLTDQNTDYYKIELPEPPVKDAVLRSWGYFATSKIGGAKHWKIAKVATPLLMSFVHPGLGLAGTMAMEYMGPQPGGEPSILMLTTSEDDAKGMKKTFSKIHKTAGKAVWGGIKNVAKGGSFKSGADKSMRDQVFEPKEIFKMNYFTSVYSISRHPIETKGAYLCLTNIDAAKAKNYSFKTFAVYNAPVFTNVKAKETHFVPNIKSTSAKINVVNTELHYTPIFD